LTPAERVQQVTHAILFAFDAETGQELYSSQDLIDDWTHLSSVTVADGKVFVTTRQTFVYAFGLKN
jgi:outer membrane protein assembly factor BamB